MLPPVRSVKTEAFYDLAELILNFNSCVISTGIIGLKKQVLYNISGIAKGGPGRA